MAVPKRVFIGSIATETNTFSPLRTDLQDFKDSFYAPPGHHPATPTLCSAVYPVARARAAELNWQIVEGTASWAEPGGIVSQQTWEFLRDQLLAELRAAMPVDIVLLGLHGAMVAQRCLDCEGELIRMVREVVGSEALIGATFDPHSHLTADRTHHADIITVFKEFPHTDFVTVAEDLIELVHRASTGAIRPEISTFDCRMIEVLPTSREPMRSFVDEIKALEGTGSVLSISIIHGFMAGDVPELGSRVVVITDGDRTGGDALARELGMRLFAMRGTTRPEFLPPETALEKALAASAGPVVIADVWDNPGGGVPGDSTIILRQMMDRKIDNAALASIWDPIAVRTCFSAGIGSTLRLRFGAKMSDQGGAPIDANIIVRGAVRDAVQSFGQSIVPLGDAVWVEVAGIDVILTSVRSQVFSPDIFSNLGIDPSSKEVLVVKSTNHFHNAFAQIASEILYAEVNGPYPSDPATNAYRHLSRSIWPRVENPHNG
ncbi:M81 family metallopeptidase [Notoacmeibacter sp. MSK16QG-6]|uniref:M81 family metallopeptidase n=1 Tax=Notoacmeibacter sp. MSK16QG-6 TaxID=2957982 RepID=UPI0020A10B56|nr:M81 family metallopeptidase [Notoacmeibacter sp. MSK16QG-6]MCP1200250.1 M81 family metallopeptidase [Notoacmeibacter sp. MSK16QG-6]